MSQKTPKEIQQLLEARKNGDPTAKTKLNAHQGAFRPSEAFRLRMTPTITPDEPARHG